MLHNKLARLLYALTLCSGNKPLDAGLVLRLVQLADAARWIWKWPFDFIHLIGTEEILCKCVMVDYQAHHAVHHKIQGAHLHTHRVELFTDVLVEFRFVGDGPVAEECATATAGAVIDCNVVRIEYHFTHHLAKR